MTWAVQAVNWPQNEVVTIRPSRLLQLGAPAAVLLYVPASLAFGVLWNDPYNVYDLSDDVPLLAALLAVVFVAVVVAVRRPVVTFTPDRLILRSVTSSRAWRWDEILWVARVRSRVMITTVDGTFALPVSANRSVPVGAASLRLTDATASAWFARRGPTWFPLPLSPWRPTCDIKGNVVLRVPISVRLVRLLVSNPIGLAWLLLLPSPLVWKAIVLLTAVVVLTAAVGVYGWWERVVVSPDRLAVRDWRGRRTIARTQIAGLVEGSRSFPLGRPPGGCLDLWLTTGERMLLPAPMTGRGLYDNDPEFYRKWAWLDRELATAVAPPPPPSPASTTALVG